MSQLRVIETSQGVMGPFAGSIFAQNGEDVIKVEPPAGDWTRCSSGKPGGRSEGILFPALNRGKRSIVLDFAVPDARDRLRALVEAADILIAGNELADAGLSPLDLAEWNGDLIQCYATAMGLSGPRARQVVDEIQILALGGLLKITGEPAREPLQIPGYHPEFIGGLHVYTSALASLIRRDRFPESGGEVLDVSAFEAVAASAEMVCTIYTFTGAVRSRFFGRQPWGIQGEVLPCKDGYIAVHPGAMDTLALLIEQPELVDDPLFRDGIYRLEHAREFLDLLQPWLAERSRAEIIAECQALRVPFGAVLDVSDLLNDEQLAARNYFVPSIVDGGTVSLPGTLFRGSSTAPHSEWPLLGQHTEETFDERGHESAEVRRRGVSV